MWPGGKLDGLGFTEREGPATALNGNSEKALISPVVPMAILFTLKGNRQGYLIMK